jgi:OTU domain-containing protein 6
MKKETPLKHFCFCCRMPISVYMYTKNSGREGPKIIAEYGQEYGKEDPIRVLYDGYGHYDALQDPIRRTTSRS